MKKIFILAAAIMAVAVVRAQNADSVNVESAGNVAGEVVVENMRADVVNIEVEPAAVVDSAAVDSASVMKPARVKRALRYDRGLAFDTKTPSMPKGMWVAGMNISYSQHDNDKYSLLILDGLNSKGNTLSVSPMLHYVFANNQSIGFRFAYKRNWLEFNIDKDDIAIKSEMLNMIFDGGLRYKYMSHSYMGYLSYRYYVGFGSNFRRLVVFNEVQAGIGGGQMREEAGQTESGGYKRQTHQTSFNFRLGFAPGVAFFMTNSLAVEVQIGLLGYEYKKLSQVSTNADNVPKDADGKDIPGADPIKVKGGRTSSSISTKFDFLSIAFGMAFYL